MGVDHSFGISLIDPFVLAENAGRSSVEADTDLIGSVVMHRKSNELSVDAE
jgi:hypothetical protein